MRKIKYILAFVLTLVFTDFFLVSCHNEEKPETVIDEGLVGLIDKAHEVCCTKRFNKPTFGSGLGRLSSISRVTRWHPLRFAESLNSVC